MSDQDIESIALTLMESRVRRDTFICLCKRYPDKIRAEEIVRRIGASKVNILGALRGMNKRYSVENSLSFMGLVSIEEELINGIAANHYCVTPFGLQVMEWMESKNMITVRNMVKR